MSHIVQIETQIKDPEAIRAGCQRLQLPEPTFGEAKLFTTRRTGWIVCLPNWTYPVVCDVNTGKVDFDNYGGRWGEQKYLGKFLQAYAVEKARLEGRRKGYATSEQTLADGSIKVTLNLTGGVA